MIDLYNATAKQLLGSITESDLKVLVDALEEEGVNDQDYYIDRATIDVIADGKATEHAVGLRVRGVGAGGAGDIGRQRMPPPSPAPTALRSRPTRCSVA